MAELMRIMRITLAVAFALWVFAPAGARAQDEPGGDAPKSDGDEAPGDEAPKSDEEEAPGDQAPKSDEESPADKPKVEEPPPPPEPPPEPTPTPTPTEEAPPAEPAPAEEAAPEGEGAAPAIEEAAPEAAPPCSEVGPDGEPLVGPDGEPVKCPEAAPCVDTMNGEPLMGPDGEPVVCPDVKPEKLDFIKGDLLYPGTRRLLSRYNHVGVSLGGAIIDNGVWATISPGAAWYFDFGLAFSIHVPLRLQAVEINNITKGDVKFGGLKLRREDWDEPADFAKIIRFISFGRKEANVYASINTMRPSTIGHGLLMKGYQGDIDVDRSLTGLVFDAYNDYAGFQLQANDITFQNRVLAGLVFFKPLSLFSDNELARSLSIGAEYITDLRAPRCLRLRAGSDQCMQGTGHEGGIPPYGGAAVDNSFVRTNPDTGRFAVKETAIHAVGGSAEFKFYKTDLADLKVYGVYHQYINDGGGGGFAGGMLARLNTGWPWISAFRLRGEYRTWEDGYQPNYFNTMYEIQKYTYVPAARDFQVAPTKYQQVFGDPQNGFGRPSHGRRHGFNLDLHWALFKHKRSGKSLALGVGMQESNGPYDSNFYAHLEFPLLGWLQIFGTYLRVDQENMGAIFGDLASEDAIVMTGLRLQVLPILFLNAHYSRSYRMVGSPGSELHLGNSRIVDARTGAPSPYFKQDSLYENVHNFFVEIEFGWEFDDDDKKKRKEVEEPEDGAPPEDSGDAPPAEGDAPAPAEGDAPAPTEDKAPAPEPSTETNTGGEG